MNEEDRSGYPTKADDKESSGSVARPFAAAAPGRQDVVGIDRHIDGIRQAKWAYVTRGLPDDRYSVAPIDDSLCPGDLVVARVAALRAHDHLEDPFGRRNRLYEGDVVVGAVGNRYATDVFEGYVPLSDRTHLLTAGGLVGTVASAHEAVGEPTALVLTGRLADARGGRLSTHDFACRRPSPARAPRGTILVVGSSMNAGKTTTVTSLVRGFERSGLRAGAGKVTGSGSGKDRWAYVDSGATHVADFLDFGVPSTFGYPIAMLEQLLEWIPSRLAGDGADVVVLEIADGVLQAETRHLLAAAKGLVDAVVLSVGDALGAVAAASIVAEASLPLVAVSGLISRSPLASREAQNALGVPVITAGQLAAGAGLPLLGMA